MSMIRSFRDLNVYQKAYAVSLRVHQLSLALPSIEQRGFADQLRRTSKGICANIAEGFGKQPYSKAEYRRFIYIALGSCDEMQVWCDYLKDLHYIEHEAHKELIGIYQEIARMIQGLIKSWT
jgi:four helix bundle protein